MSRIGKKPVALPKGVTADVKGQDVKVKGPKGELSFRLVDDVSAAVEGGSIVVKARDTSQRARAMWGMSRTQVANMIKGVSEGYRENLEITGVGFKAAVQGKNLQLQLGFSHDVVFPIPAGVAIVCEKPTMIAISGIDKQLVGQTAAKIRGWREPEPYKGKGIRYAGERILRKEGKKK
ncbi:MAG TPA: 50S ribosomal protein L6 [Micropepsaceae bacterium]|nr:50S ribosomal protein L6 [Micropepsaceae bacterium]